METPMPETTGNADALGRPATAGSAAWRRWRFKANPDDPRPIRWPAHGPWWCTGYNDEHSIVVAYLPPDVPVEESWPEAEDAEFTEEDEIRFTSRFPRPSWWKG
jgi:hypothetical protein